MFDRRTLISFVVLASLATSCRFFKPYDPNKPAAARPEASAPAAAVTPGPQAAMPAPPPPRGSISDANIAAMVLASSNTGISYARLAPSRAQRADVKEFAQRMLTDHSGVNALVTDLLKKLDLAPEDNTTSLDMRDESANKRDIMRELTSFSFDSAYITNEVSYHQKFLSSIDNVMLPSARNGELRNLLMTVRPAVAAHLAHAEQTWANVMAKR